MNHFEEKLIEAAKQHFRGLKDNDLDGEAQAGMDFLTEIEGEIKRGKVKISTNLGRKILQWLNAEPFSEKHYKLWCDLEDRFK